MRIFLDNTQTSLSGHATFLDMTRAAYWTRRGGTA